MNKLTHQQARELIQARLSGVITEPDRADLEAHLVSCPSCQKVAREMLFLEEGLRRDFSARWDSLRPPTSRSTAPYIKQMRRLNMRKKLLNLVGSTGLIAGVVLVLYFAMAVLPNRNPSLQVGAGEDATPTSPAEEAVISKDSSTSTPAAPSPVFETPTPTPLPPGEQPDDGDPGQQDIAQSGPAAFDFDTEGRVINAVPTGLGWLPEGFVYADTFLAPEGRWACIRFNYQADFAGNLYLLASAIGGLPAVEDLINPYLPEEARAMQLVERPVGGAEGETGTYILQLGILDGLCGSEDSIWGDGLLWRFEGVDYLVVGPHVPDEPGFLSELDLVKIAESITGVRTVDPDEIDPAHLRSEMEARQVAGFPLLAPGWLPEGSVFRHGFGTEDYVTLVYDLFSLDQIRVASENAYWEDEKATYPADAIEAVQVWDGPAEYVQGIWFRQGEEGPWQWDPTFPEQRLAWEANGIQYILKVQMGPSVAREAMLQIAENLGLPGWVPRLERANPSYGAILGAGACSISTQEEPGAVGTGSFSWPTQSREVIAGSNAETPAPGGISLAGQEGDPVSATDSGVVVYAGWANWGYGNLVVIDHGNGWQTAYAHLGAIDVNCGQSVSAGEALGQLGSTGNASGPYLRFEVMGPDEIVDPLNLLEP